MKHLLKAGMIAIAAVAGTQSSASLSQGQPAAVYPGGESTSLCVSYIYEVESRYAIFDAPRGYGAHYPDGQWGDYARREFGPGRTSYCRAYESRKQALAYMRKNFPAPFTEVEGFQIDWASIAPHYHRWLMENQTAEAKEVEQPQPKKNTQPNRTETEVAAKPDPAEEARKLREQREAEWQAELDKYAADKAAWQARIDAQKREEERKQAEHEARQEAAARKLAEFERKKASHARLIEEHMKRQQEFEAAQRRHTLCVNGNKQACDEIAAGKPGAGERLADAGDASSDKGPLRGFWGKTCEAARRNAQGGAGSVAGNTFEEVRAVPQENGCLVQGYRYGGHGTASRQ